MLLDIILRAAKECCSGPEQFQLDGLCGRCCTWRPICLYRGRQLCWEYFPHFFLILPLRPREASKSRSQYCPRNESHCSCGSKVWDAVQFSERKKQKLSTLALKFEIGREMNLDAATLNQHIQNLFNEASAMNGEDKDAQFSRESASFPAAAPASAQAPTQEPIAQPTDTVDDMYDN